MALEMLTNVSIAFVYREASFKSETVTQTYLAETLEVLEEQGEWVRVRLEDGYEGWVARFYLVQKPDDWDKNDFYSGRDQIAWIYQSPDNRSTTMRDMTLLSKLPLLEKREGWVQVKLPDGRAGWVEYNPRHLVEDVDMEALIETAFTFLGIQYFWGGKSPKGFDCSGFVQTSYFLQGFQLPRDAYQQAEIGRAVSDDFNQWQVGDLIYFTERNESITHVAISLGNGDFIHASGYVKLNSLNPDHTDLYIEKYAKIYTKTMRII